MKRKRGATQNYTYGDLDDYGFNANTTSCSDGDQENQLPKHRKTGITSLDAEQIHSITTKRESRKQAALFDRTNLDIDPLDSNAHMLALTAVKLGHQFPLRDHIKDQASYVPLYTPTKDRDLYDDPPLLAWTAYDITHEIGYNTLTDIVHILRHIQKDKESEIGSHKTYTRLQRRRKARVTERLTPIWDLLPLHYQLDLHKLFTWLPSLLPLSHTNLIQRDECGDIDGQATYDVSEGFCLNTMECMAYNQSIVTHPRCPHSRAQRTRPETKKWWFD